MIKKIEKKLKKEKRLCSIYEHNRKSIHRP